MKLYVGIDLHSTNCFIAIIDENGDVKFQQKVQNDIIMIKKLLKVFKPQIAKVAVESTFNWYWLVDGLQEEGYKVVLANPVKMKQYSGLKYSDDKSDAIWIAEMMRLNILPTGYIYPRQERTVRDLLRKRTQLMQHRVSLILSLKSLIHNWTGERISRSWITNITSEEVNDLLNDESTKISALSSKEVIKIMDNEIKLIEKTVLSKIKLRKEFKNLLNVWGIGQILAMTIMLETGELERFENVGDYSSYCRCVPTKRISNGKQKGVGNKKNGNKYLAWAFIEAAQYMQQHYEKARTWYQRKSDKTNKMVARKALSNKIARACYYIMRDQCSFNPSKLFG